jgi:chitinase
MIHRFLTTALSGILPSGAKMKAATLDPLKLVNGWNKLYDVSLPQIGAIVTDVKGWTKPLTPNERIFEVLGSYAYRGGMSLLPRDMNGFKRNIIIGNMPMDLVKFRGHLKDAADNGNEEAVKKMLGVLQKVSA